MENCPWDLPWRWGPWTVVPDPSLPALQILKIIKKPVPDTGLLSLFQVQNPLFH